MKMLPSFGGFDVVGLGLQTLVDFENFKPV